MTLFPQSHSQAINLWVPPGRMFGVVSSMTVSLPYFFPIKSLMSIRLGMDGVDSTERVRCQIRPPIYLIPWYQAVQGGKAEVNVT